jgi:MFS family permease
MQHTNDKDRDANAAAGDKEAVSMNRRYIVYGLLFLVSVITYFDRVVLSVTLPVLSKDFNLDPVQQGYLLSAFLWIYVCLLVPAGILLDWMGTRRLVAVSIIFWSLMTMASGATFNFVGMLATRVLLGVGEAPAYPACVRAVREWAPLRERAWATSIFGAGANFGTAVSAVAITWVMTVWGWRMAFVASGACGLVFVVFWLWLYQDPRKASWLKEGERKFILSERSPGGTDGKGLPVFKLMQYRAMWALVLVQGCINYTNYLTLSWLPTYLVRSRGLDLMHSGYYFAIINIGACLFTLWFGRVSDALLTAEAAARGGRRYAVVLFCVMASTVLLVPLIESTWLLVVVLTISATGVQSALTNNYAQTSDLLRDGGGIGKAVGLLILGGNTFGIAAPIATGYLLSMTGQFTSAFILASGLLLAGAVLSLTCTTRAIGEELPEIARVPALAGTP